VESPTPIPNVGAKAPAFNLDSDQGEKIRLSSLQGQAVVLFFYPKDNTPGCTVEANEFRDSHAKFEALGVRVLGISPDTVKSHCGFIEKQSLNYSLLADPDKKAIEKYGLWVEKKLYGRVYMGVQRATFLIDAKGKVAAVWPRVKPKGHAEAVLTAAEVLVK
jgi:thioredoxin-dependent peroxiredoxin